MMLMSQEKCVLFVKVTNQQENVYFSFSFFSEYRLFVAQLLSWIENFDQKYCDQYLIPNNDSFMLHVYPEYTFFLKVFKCISRLFFTWITPLKDNTGRKRHTDMSLSILLVEYFIIIKINSLQRFPFQCTLYFQTSRQLPTKNNNITWTSKITIT